MFSILSDPFFQTYIFIFLSLFSPTECEAAFPFPLWHFVLSVNTLPIDMDSDIFLKKKTFCVNFYLAECYFPSAHSSSHRGFSSSLPWGRMTYFVVNVCATFSCRFESNKRFSNRQWKVRESELTQRKIRTCREVRPLKRSEPVLGNAAVLLRS